MTGPRFDVLDVGLVRVGQGDEPAGPGDRPTVLPTNDGLDRHPDLSSDLALRKTQALTPIPQESLPVRFHPYSYEQYSTETHNCQQNKTVDIGRVHQGRWLKARIQATTSISEFMRRAGVSRTQLYAWFQQSELSMRPDLMWALLDTLGLSDVARQHGYTRDLGGSTLIEMYLARQVFADLIKQRGVRGPITTPGPDASLPSRRTAELHPVNDDYETVELRRVPFFDFQMSASGWSDGFDGRTIDEADGFIEVPADAPSDAFAFRIRGDCMEPTFPDAAVVICVPVRPGDHGQQFVAGKAYYFQRAGAQATFKLCFYEPPKSRYRLECINKKYKAMYVPEQDMQRMSRAIKMVIEL